MHARSRRASARQPMHLTALLFALLLLATACGPRFDRDQLTIAGGNAGGGQAGAPVDQGSGTVVDPGLGTDPGDGGVVDPGLGTDPGDPGAGGVDGGPDAGEGGTADPGSSGTGGGTTPPGGPTGGTTPPPGGSTGGGSTGGGSTGGGSTGGGSTGGGTTPPPSGPGPSPGVTDDSILIGYLLPLTGAAPLPAGFDDGVNVYWEWLNENGGINGREVTVNIYNTDSNTSTAVSEAQRAVQEDKVFTLLSLDRLEVQAAIANFLEQVGMPHVMVQSPANPPSSWKNTFIGSVDHAVQGRGIATFMAEELGGASGTPVGFVREQTSALKPGTDAFESRAAEHGMPVVAKLTTDPQNNDQSSVVSALIDSGAEVVWLYMAPTVAANIIASAGARGYQPIWFANNISWQFELMHGGGANQFLNGSYAFSSWVPLNDPRADEYKAEYQRQISSQDPTKQPDDIGLVGWGAGEVIADVIGAAGQDLGWDSFRNSLQNFKKPGNVWTGLDFTGGFIGSNVVKVYQSDGTQWSLVEDARVLR